jgi:hypothetical protein
MLFFYLFFKSHFPLDLTSMTFKFTLEVHSTKVLKFISVYRL